MSRIRQIKPSWFLDKELRRGTTADAREFYIGLWMLADDDGWLDWDPERIGAELFPYEPVARRERNVERWAEQLETLSPESPHLVVYDCGHANVPKMRAHQRIAGSRTVRTHDEHVLGCRNACSRLEPKGATEHNEPILATRSPGIGIGKVGNGKVRNGSHAGARTQSDAPAPSEFEAGMRGAGFDPSRVGK